MNLTQKIDPVSKSREDSTQKSEPLDAHQRRLEQAVAGLKAAASSPSADKGSGSTVGTVPPLIYVTDLPPRATGNASSFQAEWQRPAKRRGAVHVFAALALFFAGYVAALFTDFAAPELITKLGVRGMEYGDPPEASPALDERADLKRDLKAAREEILIAKDKEAEWMRVFEEDDTKAVALSRDLEAARREVTGYSAAVSALRSEVSEAKDARAAADVKVQELTLAIGAERDKVVSLTRDRGELNSRSVSSIAARNEFLQQRRTANLTESEWNRRLDSAIQELDQLRNLAPTATDSRQLPSSGLPAPEFQPAAQPDPVATGALSNEGSRDGKVTPRLANRPPLTGRLSKPPSCCKLRGPAPGPNDRASLRAAWGW